VPVHDLGRSGDPLRAVPTPSVCCLVCQRTCHATLLSLFNRHAHGLPKNRRSFSARRLANRGGQYPGKTRVDVPESGRDDWCLKSTGVSMFPPASQLLSIVLIAATAFGAVVPARSTCAVKVHDRGSKQCCGACCATSSMASRTCCSEPVPASTCRCSVDHERPAAPQEQRSSGERDGARRADCVLSIAVIADDRPTALPIEDAFHLSSLPTLRHLAALCRWLI